MVGINMHENAFCLVKFMCFAPTLEEFKIFGLPYIKVKKYLVRIYPCGVPIQRSSTGKLVLYSQNINWMALSQEKSQKPLKPDILAKRLNYV